MTFKAACKNGSIIAYQTSAAADKAAVISVKRYTSPADKQTFNTVIRQCFIYGFIVSYRSIIIDFKRRTRCISLITVNYWISVFTCKASDLIGNMLWIAKNLFSEYFCIKLDLRRIRRFNTINWYLRNPLSQKHLWIKFFTEQSISDYYCSTVGMTANGRIKLPVGNNGNRFNTQWIQCSWYSFFLIRNQNSFNHINSDIFSDYII